MERLYVTVAVVLVSFVGLLKLWKQNQNIAEKHAFAGEFFGNLKKYLESNGTDTGAYTWLINRSTRLQMQMGSEGVYGAYKPPLQNYRITNYPIILNMVPELHHTLSRNSLSGMNTQLAEDYASNIQEALIRHLGTIEDFQKAHVRELRNPVIWFREGVRSIVAFPVTLLSWFGLMSSETVATVTGNFVFSSISAMIGLIGFLSSVITIVLGWEQFVTMAQTWLAIF